MEIIIPCNFILFPDCLKLFYRQRIKNFVYCLEVGCLILLGEVILLLKQIQNSYFDGNTTLGIEMVMITEAIVV